MRVLLAILLLSSFSLFSLSASAEVYYWRVSYSQYNGTGSSPEASYQDACSRVAGCQTNGYYKPAQHTLTKVNDTQWTIREYFASGIFNQAMTANRYGTECGPGLVFNADTGKCEGDPCLPTIGQETHSKHRIGDFLGNGQVGSRTPPPGSVCRNSCQYAWDQGPPQNLYRFQDNNPNGVWGDYKYLGNGVTCVGETPPQSPPGQKDPSQTQSQNCTNKVTDAEGRISYSCTATSQFKDPGSMNCGSVNGGAYTCTPRANPPKFEDKNIKKDIQTAPGTNGSSTNTTTTTTTTTSCVGANACTTTTTIHTGTGTTNGDGSPGGSSSTCSGPGCGGSDDGSGTPDPQEPTDEEPPCDPATDPNKCGLSSVGGEACDVSVECSGDAIQCAILRAQKKATCDYEKENNYDLVKQEIATKAAGESYSLDDEEFDFSNQFSTGSRFLPTGCPSPRSFYVSSFNKTYQIKYDPICDFAGTLSYIVVAMASLFFVTYVGRSFGGS